MLEIKQEFDRVIAQLTGEGAPYEVAVVVHLHGALSEKELIDFARSRQAPYKVPTRILFTDEPLPRNAANKLLKPAIKKAALEHFGLSA